jgi:hypothetical protein
VRAHCLSSAEAPLLAVTSHVHSYLDLQEVIATDALVVHLVVGVIGIATTLVLDEGEAAGLLEPCGRVQGMRYSQAGGRRARGGDVAADQAAVSGGELELKRREDADAAAGEMAGEMGRRWTYRSNS